MNDQKKKELNRAARIIFITNSMHVSIASIYEGLVDKEYVSVSTQAQSLIKDLREILKRIRDDDDF
jgi:hypothetical protein